MIKKTDRKNKFISMFNPTTGFYMRSGVIENGVDTGIDPFMSTFPELIDIGIMASCPNKINGVCKVQCYQGGSSNYGKPNMSLEDYKTIINQIKGKVYQVALGGNGDPNKHEEFIDILKTTRENDIIPNYTTSGYNLTEKEISATKAYCGAVAVSFYGYEHTSKVVEKFISNGIKTNIHYVLGNNSIDEAIERLKNNSFPKGINAVIFLLHKNVGLGADANVLSTKDKRVREFYELIDNKAGELEFKIGFDSCNIPALLNYTNKLNRDSFDTCEAGRWSCYITADMKLLPCSFDNQELRWAVDLYKNTIKEGWNGAKFEDFRNHFKKSCRGCDEQLSCLGGCPIRRNIVLCDRKEKDFYEGKIRLCN